MALASTQRFSSSSTSTPGRIYDVFLSFRGEDTRHHFTDHLYSALIDNGVHTFRDDEELERGEVIAPGLLEAIEQSRISIVVFSENYAQSTWCLDELAKIIECMIERKQIVLPVFYHVDPSHVRKQMGSYGEAFAYHEKDADLKKRGKIQKWRTALTKTSNLSGWHLQGHQSESDVIKKITNKIITRLNTKNLYVGENLVGMNIRLEKLRSLINIDSNNVRMVGICGFGGMGKTTLAKALYNEVLNQFESVSFLANVREKSENDFGLLQLQQQLVNDIRKRKNREISNVHEGINVIKNALYLRRVFVVLDDVDNLRQLEHLVGKHDWFGQGSRILITTRDRHLLDAHGVDKPYHEIEELNYEEAFQLFSQYAFKQNFPQEDYKDLSYLIVKYAKGVPLALKVLGSLLCKKTIPEWESELHKLEREPALEIQNVLKISFHGLDCTQREIFLDIACFFKGQEKDFVSRILDGCGFYAERGFRVLCDKCLITILNNKIHMHDLIQQMGWEIVREQCPKEPSKWSRLWEPKDAFHVLTRNTGTEAIEGIFLDMSTSEQMQFTTKAFKMMNKLRLLKVHQDANYNSVVKPWILMEPSEVHLSLVHFCRDFEFPSQELRYLHWDGYPLESLPSNFYAKNLVELNLRCSKIKQLWKATALLENLKVINLSYSLHLNEIPNPSSVPNLETLTLEGCMNLESLPRSIYKLRHLKTLCCRRCVSLISFPEIMGNMENLRELYLNYTAIVKLPSSIGHLKGLEYLTLARCDYLITVPQSICNLTSLKVLSIGCCSKLEKLPDNLKSLKCLEKLYLDTVNCQLPSLSGLCSLRELFLSMSNLTHGVIQRNNLLNSLEVLDLSSSNVIDKGILIHICHLLSLEVLYLSNCNLMDGEIPSEICQLSSLEVLDLSWNHFSSIPASISQLSKLKALGLSHCNMLLQIPELPSSLRLLDAHNSHCTLSSPSSFLPWHFLFTCFQSKFQDFECRSSSSQVNLRDSSYFGEGISIVIPGISGIPEWIMDQNKGNYVTIDLPQDWYEDKDFLGFALCSAYVPLEDESEDDFEHGFKDKSENQSENESHHDEWAHKSEDESENGSAYKSDNKSEYESVDRFKDEFSASSCLECELNIHGHLFEYVDFLHFCCYCECYDNGAVSDQMWVTYYPKVSMKGQCHSDRWTHLRASFDGFYGSNKRFKVKKCGIRLIYNQESHTLATMPDNWNMECLQKLYLDGTAIKEIPSSIDSLSTLVEFYTRNCENLESLPWSICRLKYLQVLCCSDCSKLGSFPEVMENMNNLRELHLDGTAIQDLPSSIENLKGLEFMDLTFCKNLVTLPTHICNLKSLKTLDVFGCSKLKLPKSLGSLQCLEHLDAGCLGSIASQLPSLSGLCSLRILHLNGSNLIKGSIQDDICCLYSLELLNLTNCNLIDDGIPDKICHLLSLQVLYLSRNHFCSIPSGISQLSKLRVLGLSHSKMVVAIPELPSSLRSIDVHDCTGLKTLSSPSSLLWASLFKCFKSAIQDLECGNYWSDPFPEVLDEFCYYGEGISILIPRSSGIPEWIRHQKKGSRVTTELPRYWYENNDLLGFALFSVHIPLDNESISKDEDLAPCSLKCELTLCGDQFAFLNDLSLESWCKCYENDGASGQVWVLYYPKVAIEEKYHSNKWRRLKASFHGYFNGMLVKVEKCGMQLIYAENDEYNRPTLIQHNDSQENLGDQRSTVEDANVNDQRSCDDAENTTQKNHLPIMHYTNGNDPGVQDDEQNQMPRWLNLLFNIVEWICCRRH